MYKAWSPNSSGPRADTRRSLSAGSRCGYGTAMLPAVQCRYQPSSHLGPQQKTFFTRKGKQSLCVKAIQPANLEGKPLACLHRKDTKKEALPGLTSTVLLKWLVVSGLSWVGVKGQQLHVPRSAVVKLFSGLFASSGPQALPARLRWFCSVLARSTELPGRWVQLFRWFNLQLN